MDKRSIFAGLFSGLMISASLAFADGKPYDKVCEFGLAPLPGGVCINSLPPPPPSHQCELYGSTKINDGKMLSDNEFGYLLSWRPFNLIDCVQLMTVKQKKQYDKRMKEIEMDLRVLDDDLRPQRP